MKTKNVKRELLNDVKKYDEVHEYVLMTDMGMQIDCGLAFAMGSIMQLLNELKKTTPKEMMDDLIDEMYTMAKMTEEEQDKYMKDQVKESLGKALGKLGDLLKEATKKMEEKANE